MAKVFLGTCACPDCNIAGANVGLTKNGEGLPYSHCDSAECEGAQWWTHGAGGKPRLARVKKLLTLLSKGKPAEGVDVQALAAKFGVTLDVPAPAPAPAPVGDPAPAAKPAAGGFGFFKRS